MFDQSRPARSYNADPPRHRSAGGETADTTDNTRVRVETQMTRMTGGLTRTREECETDEADALRAESALLIARRGPNAGFRRPLDQAVTTVGRHPDSDVLLDAVTVSRRHAEFRRQGADFVVVDVGSFNGTYVNGALSDMAVLTDGDEVQIGKFRLVFRAAQPRHGTDGSLKSGPASSPETPPAAQRGRWKEMSTRLPRAPETGGDPVCWMHLLCPECGRIADEEPPTRCGACGAVIPGD